MHPSLTRHAPPRGFTLIEILVVIVILGVLAALIVPNVISRPDEARVTVARSDIAAIMSALKIYRLDNQRYPTAEQGLAALVAKPEQPPVPANWKPGGSPLAVCSPSVARLTFWTAVVIVPVTSGSNSASAPR